jgi:hypothetical protein
MVGRWLERERAVLRVELWQRRVELQKGCTKD